MAEGDGGNAGTTTTTTDAGGGNAVTTATGQTFTQEQVNDLIAREKGKIQGKFADYNDLKAAAARLTELENANKTDLQKLEGERDTLKQQLTPLQQENLRLKVALKKGLVGDKASLAERLKGTSEAEMEADADELLKLVAPGGGGGFDGGARGAAKTGSFDDVIRRQAGY